VAVDARRKAEASVREHQDQVAAVLLSRPDDRLEGMIALRLIAVRLDAGLARALGEPVDDLLRLLARDAIVLVDGDYLLAHHLASARKPVLGHRGEPGDARVRVAREL